ncbi:MAG: hypothetical protein HZA79_03535 [Sphingobacteriales bacterium]|nr:hypothetical protein [Sphingobacteriales bacterium]
MTRKRYTKQEESPETLKIREKKKWQIALRRYVLERHPCAAYASYFGLDITNMRSWFESQFKEGIGWEDFGKKWQFDHIIPVAYFDFTREEDLKACWGFPNLSIEYIPESKETGKGFNMLAARNFFQTLWEKTHYAPCKALLSKLTQLEDTERLPLEPRERFIREKIEYLSLLEGYTQYEFGLLNSGKSPADIEKEVRFLKNFEK